MSKTELQEYQEAEVIQLIQDALVDLHLIGDRLERFANEQLQLQQERESRGQGE